MVLIFQQIIRFEFDVDECQNLIHSKTLYQTFGIMLLLVIIFDCSCQPEAVIKKAVNGHCNSNQVMTQFEMKLLVLRPILVEQLWAHFKYLWVYLFIWPFDGCSMYILVTVCQAFLLSNVAWESLGLTKCVY